MVGSVCLRSNVGGDEEEEEEEDDDDDDNNDDSDSEPVCVCTGIPI
jgi:hypothetical protein